MKDFWLVLSNQATNKHQGLAILIVQVEGSGDGVLGWPDTMFST